MTTDAGLDRGVVVGVDLGGTKIAAAVVAVDGSCGAISTVATPASQGPDALLDAVAALVVEVAAGQPISAVGVGAAGAIDRGRGVVVSSTATLRGWTGTAVAEGIQDRLRTRLRDRTRWGHDSRNDQARVPHHLDVPVAVLNDVDAHALGEARHGAAADAASVLVVAAGTGIGGAVVLDGDVLRGAHHMAGEMGHLPVPGAEGLWCPCGREGHLEAIASGVGLARLHARSFSSTSPSSSPSTTERVSVEEGDRPGERTGAQSSRPDAREIVARAGAGDPDAQESVRRSATALGRGIAGVVTVLDPEVVVLTGGLSEAGDLWWSCVETALRADLVDHLSGVPLRRGALGGSAALIGAAEAARDLLTRTHPSD